MTVQDADICNRALVELGARRIPSLQEGSKEADACLEVYGPAVEQMLRAAQWGFAKAMVTATLLKSAPGTPEFTGTVYAVWDTSYPTAPWFYEYAYPADCCLVRKVIPQGAMTPFGDVPFFPQGIGVPSPLGLGAAKWETGTDTIGGVQQTVILTNACQALVLYNRAIVDPSLWDSLFTEGLVAAIAGKIAPSVVQDGAQRAPNLIALANQKIMTARAISANEGTTLLNCDAEWIKARAGGLWTDDLMGFARDYSGLEYGAPIFGPLF